MTQIVQSLAEISARYEALFVDLWGCVHDGYQPFPTAVQALKDYRAKGGIVVLVTNSPRHRGAVEKQLAKIGVDPDAWDSIATSGDSARAAMFRGVVGEKVFFIGDPTDTSFFDPIKIIETPTQITRVPLDEAEGIVCTGPFDPSAPPTAVEGQLLLAKQKRLKLLCANPDIVVDRGDTREWCAGAIAQLYTEMGGESLYFGKPHPPIYDLARRRLAQIAKIPDDAILCIGDGIGTDIQGAQGEDLDSLFITGGLAAEETGTRNGHPDAAQLQEFLISSQMSPAYSIGMLR